MFVCTRCRSALVREKNPAGYSWRCTKCGGRAASIGFLRKAAGAERANRIWNGAWDGAVEEDRPCPLCAHPMRAVFEGIDGIEVHLDVCRACRIVWFDPSEYRCVAPDAPADSRSNAVSAEAVMAMADLEMRKVDARREMEAQSGGEPMKPAQVVMGALGLPVEQGVERCKRPPVVTWLVALGMALGYAVTSLSSYDFILEYGWLPSEPMRYGGLTFISSFFLHGSISHILGNLAFLLIFGDNVEDWLGRGRYILVLGLSALSGVLAHSVLHPDPTVPLIGASGGISGILACYAVRYPNARISFLWWIYYIYIKPRWISLPAWIALVAWVGWQFILASMQLSGYGSVSAVGHLGGAAVGLAYAFAFKD